MLDTLQDGRTLMLGGMITTDGRILHRTGTLRGHLSFVRANDDDVGEPLPMASEVVVEQNFEGVWWLTDDHHGQVQAWLRCLTIHGDQVKDFLGNRHRLERRGGRTLLSEGLLSLERGGQVLCRVGRSGLLLIYMRMNVSCR